MEWECSYGGGIVAEEVGIASAFESSIAQRGDYLLVDDEKLSAAVRRFIRQWRKGARECLTPNPATNRTVAAKDPEANDRPKQTDFLIGCTLEERSYCVRLVRLLRDNYWVTTFVRHILDQEAKTPWQLTINKFKSLLDDMDTLEVLAGSAQRLGHGWSDHPILRAIRKEWGDREIEDYKGNRRVQKLIDSAHQEQNGTP